MATIRPYAAEKYMLIDSSSRRNLELVETLREKQKRGSLLWVLDKTKTAMGARTLRSYVEQPLIDRDEIEERLEALEELNKNGMLRDEIREYLAGNLCRCSGYEGQLRGIQAFLAWKRSKEAAE